MQRLLIPAIRVGVLVLALIALVVPQAPGPAEAAPRPVKVLTRNLYLGTSLTPIFTAPSLPVLAARATAGLQEVQATDFPSRAKALAREIKDADPDLIGLQEVSLWRRGQMGMLDGPATPATIVLYDFLQILEAELSAQGLKYTVLVAQSTSDGEVPSTLGYDIRLTQGNAILGRAGAPSDEFSVANATSGIYATVLTLPTVAGPAVDKRGWTAVDATVNKRQFRFINTHLDSTVPAIRVAQANELAAGPANTPLPVVLVGDLNSAPGEAGPSAYAALLAAGFKDTWTQANPSSPGLTCCNAQNLLNSSPSFTQRIDHVLTRPTVVVDRSKLVGADGDNRTTSGLWPSDHAGVIATLAP